MDKLYINKLGIPGRENQYQLQWFSDLNGLVVAEATITIPESEITRFEHDEFGRVTKQTDKDGVIEFSHDPVPVGKDDVIERDDRGNVIKITQPDGSVTTRTYNTNNKVLTIDFPEEGHDTHYSYYEKGVRVYASRFGKCHGWEVDENGNLLDMMKTNREGFPVVHQFDLGARIS